MRSVKTGVPISKKKLQKRIRNTIISLCRYAFFISFSFVVLYPFIYMLINSLKGVMDFSDPVVQWVPKHFTTEHYPNAVRVFDIWRSIGNTLIFEIVASLLQFCACAVAAYGLARFEFRGKKILMGAMILSILVPPMMIITPSYATYSQLDFLGILKGIANLTGYDLRPNLINTPLAFYLPSVLGVGLKGSFFIFIFMQFYRKLPKELEEAAWIDGAGPWKTFLKIAVPNSGPAVITVLLFSVVWHWNDFYLAQMYASDHPMFSVAINSFSDNTVSNVLGVDLSTGNFLAIPILLAGCVLFIVPMVAFYAVIQKKFIASVTNSGITG